MPVSSIPPSQDRFMKRKAIRRRVHILVYSYVQLDSGSGYYRMFMNNRYVVWIPMNINICLLCMLEFALRYRVVITACSV